MDDGVSLPRSTLQKAVKGALPPGMRMASDAMDVLTVCCNEFVHLVSAQSNVISDREKRSTISPEHVLKALEELGFDAFLGPVKEVLGEFKDEQRQFRVGARKVSQESLSKEQLLELQQQLFAAARERSLSEPSAMEQAGEPKLAAAHQEQA